MSLAAAFVADLDDRSLDLLADLLADRIAARTAHVESSSPWLDVAGAALYLRCSPQRIYDLRHAGALTPHRDGRRLLFNRADLDRYLNEAG